MTVRENLTEFYNKNNLARDGGVNLDWNKFSLGKFSIHLPNLNKEGYLLHDVNHLLCGYHIDYFGEFETAGWELGSGGRKGFGLSWLYPIIGYLLGMITIPRRTTKAFKEGRKRKNAHILSKNYQILEMEMDQLMGLSNSLS